MKGLCKTIQLGIFSSLQPSNVRLRRAIKNQEQAVEHELYPLLFDPQTAGGLLATVPEEHADSCVANLRSLGYPHACVIGQVHAQTESVESILIEME